MSTVTIVIPIYNVEKYIEKCIESLINQTYKNIEIFAISDGSPDRSMEIVEKYAKQDKRIKPMYKENGGYGSVLEYAIQKIKTKYFLICDPDDWLLSNTIEKLYNIAESNNVDLVVGDLYFIYSNGEKKYYRCSHNNYNINPNKVIMDKNELGNCAFMGCSPHSKLFVTNKAKEIIFPYNVSYTDTLLYLVYLDKCQKVYYINESLSFYYFDRPDNTATNLNTTNYTQKTFNSQFAVLTETFKQIRVQKNGYILYRIYSEAISIAFKLKYIESKEAYIECKEKLFELFNELSEYKFYMKKSIKENNLILRIMKYIIFILLNNKVTSKLFYNILLKIQFKKYRGSSHA